MRFSPVAGLFVLLFVAGCDCGGPRISQTFDAGCSTETCDGTDQDCDGVVDNGLPTLKCGVGACVREISSCIDGETHTCVEGTPGLETCNGIDDDCNGEVDDNLPPLECGTGECAVNVSACVEGVEQTCTPGQPTAERCDGKDNDCNGMTDDGIAQVTCGEGACARTVDSCLDGLEQGCTPGDPTTEVCDGVDNNCDGQTDEGLPQLVCGVGECSRMAAACVMGQGQICSPGAPVAETCDGKDNDCDGVIDNGQGPISCGQGVCRRTVNSCVNGVPQACSPGAPSADICDGLDNDCNGTIDDNGICNPPVVLCEGAVSGRVGEAVSLSATAIDLDGTIVNNTWIVVIKPTGSTAQPTPNNQITTSFTPDVAGRYVLAFCARDNAGTTTCCNTTINTTQCTSPPAPPVSTACGTSWDGRPIVQFAPVPTNLQYQLRVAGSPLVRATANETENYLRPALRLVAGGPPPGTATDLEVRSCRADDLSCCSTPSTVTVNVVESCTTPISPTSSNLVLSEYVTNGEGSCSGAATHCQAGEAVEFTNLSHCPVSLDGFHFAYRNPGASANSVRWMNFGAGEVVPPRGVYVAIRDQAAAPICSAAFSLATQSSGLFGLRVSTLDMEGQFLDTGWFNNAGGGSSIMQVSPGQVPSGGPPDFFSPPPIAQVAPYVGGTVVCQGVGFNAVNTCGDFMGTTTPTTVLSPNQLGRLWHPCDVMGPSAVPTCVRN
jgi:hypothetical protein